MMSLRRISKALVKELRRLRFGQPVSHVYNPLEYAWRSYCKYTGRYGSAPRRILFVGMNPGPWGMVQTGVPFGEVNLVREWLGISARIDKPAREHPKRPVLGFDCPRREISGARLWGWARDTFQTPSRFFADFFIVNYCPLCFVEATGRNRTPDKLPADERRPLFAACDRALQRTVECLRSRHVIGIGAFAESRLRTALDDFDVVIGRILHPSPASPAANKNWPAKATAALAGYGIQLPVS